MRSVAVQVGDRVAAGADVLEDTVRLVDEIDGTGQIDVSGEIGVRVVKAAIQDGDRGARRAELARRPGGVGMHRDHVPLDRNHREQERAGRIGRAVDPIGPRLGGLDHLGQLELEHRLDFRGLGQSVAHQALRLRVIEPAHRSEAQLVVLETHLAAQELDPSLERGRHPGLERHEVAGGLSFGAGGGELGLLNDGRGIGGVVTSGESCKDDRERHGPERIRRHTSSLEEGGQQTRDMVSGGATCDAEKDDEGTRRTSMPQPRDRQT
jgi:hypothetical protein